MSDKFNGFSQDEINKISNPKMNKKISVESVKQAFTKQLGIRRMPDKIFKQGDQLRKLQVVRAGKAVPSKAMVSNNNSEIPNESDSVAVAIENESLNLDRSMSESIENALYYAPLNMQTQEDDRVPELNSSEDTNDGSILKVSETSNGSNFTNESNTTTQNIETKSSKTDSPYKGVSLKDFEAHRLMIKEQNNQKKEILYKAIEKHAQKTAAEVHKIEEIRQELQKLESDLAIDVGLLRKQIDCACVHFANVEKQYMKIEAQFLKAKIDLHTATERKDLLTEHLCTVIAHNEDRKAKRLTELMEKVGLTNEDN